MPLYECVFIARNDITQQQVEDITNGITSLIENEEGSIKKREYWGLRSLAYRVKKNRKGHYTLLCIDAKPSTVKEVERQFNLNEDVLRSITLRIEEIDEAPSAILSRKSDDRERPSGGNRPPKSTGRYESGRKHGGEDDRHSSFNAEDNSLSLADVEEEGV